MSNLSIVKSSNSRFFADNSPIFFCFTGCAYISKQFDSQFSQSWQLCMLLTSFRRDIYIYFFRCQETRPSARIDCLWGCSIITSRIGSGWISAFLVVLRDGKQEGEVCVAVKISLNVFLYNCEEIRVSSIQNINGKFTCINGHSIFAIILYMRSFPYKVVYWK